MSWKRFSDTQKQSPSTAMSIKNFTSMSFNSISYLYDLHKVMRNQWLSPSQLKKIQEEKLKALLHHAYTNVDYYHKLFDQAGIKPEDVHTIQDINKIPYTTRKGLQALNREEITATGTDLAHCINLRTSGSTGMPLDIFCSSQEIRQRWLSYRRMYFGSAGKLTDKEIIITTPRHFTVNNWFQNHGILEIKYISIFDDAEKQLKVILEFRPQIIDAYPSTLKNLAIEIKNRKIKCIKPRLIFTTAELFTEADRKLIASVFQAELFDRYACNEVGTIAFECRANRGYHIDMDNVIVEVIKEDGTKARAGEEGEIVITSLNSYTMPFIRYRLGDTGVFSDERCPCRRIFPLMKNITGRSNDYFVLPNGRKIPPYALMIIMDSISEVKRYQVIQEKENKIRINIFQNEMITNETIAKISKRYQEFLGSDIEVEPIIVIRDINMGKTGKFKVIFSKISDNGN